ncbi:hypothetical protein FAZ15_22270 [Sphingobacterium olei]|uniref:RHS repeat-associated core domain-containing protein n=1 Tax=Sphingobacterium olei TaxID=2571155 RepID=A0A4U0N6P1_9SPHI|nr:RHS repeat-associated core domain-containing protein [Sphingobacterium olei]TJZ49425.1 hypothetical protein FAZ15_22270 [Sphingobacterium olei]
MSTGELIFDTEGGAPTLRVFYYDQRGHLVQTASQNHLGGSDYETSVYNFAGELLSSKREHSVTSLGSQAEILTSYGRDHVGRLTHVRKKVDGQPEVIQSELRYNEIGQVKQKLLHSQNNGANYATSIDYSYNERGWGKRITSPYFTEELKYGDPSGGGQAQFNGNISERYWGHGATVSSNFRYVYDLLNRLVDGLSTTSQMREEISYDKMGNIMTLRRDNGSQISYMYTGNRLDALSGGISGTYLYNANGSAIKDRRDRHLGYNHLDLLQTVSIGDTAITYTYDAKGTKLRKSITMPGNLVQRDYIWGIEYNKSGSSLLTVERIMTEEGYLQNINGVYVYHYNILDYQGNVRSTLQIASGAAVVIQKDDYYPLGKRSPILISGVNSYLYSSKEIQEELGGQYDYGARFYDAEIGRWYVLDMLADHALQIDKSPYSFAWGNSIRYVDPDGLCPECELYRPHAGEGDSYISQGGATYFYSNGQWTRNGGMLQEVFIGKNKDETGAGASHFISHGRIAQVQAALDIIGMTDIPILSQLAELTGAGISISQGDYVSAGLSIGAMVPLLGKPFEAMKLARRVEQLAKVGKLKVAGQQLRRYERNLKHGTKNSGRANKAPTNPERSLANSLELPGNTTRRVGADKSTGEFNVFDEHTSGVFHGHSRTWGELSQDMKNMLIKSGVVNTKGKILK